jgi:protein TonB
MDAVITPRDRLSFTVFLAASLHAALILGVGFAWHVEHERSPTIEVTLAQHDDRVAPDKADFLAQSNQLGSGDAAEARETTTTEAADFHDSTVQQVASNRRRRQSASPPERHSPPRLPATNRRRSNRRRTQWNRASRRPISGD